MVKENRIEETEIVKFNHLNCYVTELWWETRFPGFQDYECPFHYSMLPGQQTVWNRDKETFSRGHEMERNFLLGVEITVSYPKNEIKMVAENL